MSLTVWDKGDTCRIEGAFYNASEVLTDPTTVALQVTTPAGVTSTYTLAAAEVVKASDGNFYYDQVLTEIGHWFWQWTATGPVQAVEPGEIVVKGTGY